MDDELRAKRQYAGRMGALACLAKFGPKAVGRRRYEGRVRNLAAAIDPDGMLSEAERMLRVNYEIRKSLVKGKETQRRQRAERQRETTYGRSEEQMNELIRFIAQPPVFCVSCTPLDQRPANASGGLCSACARKVLRASAA